MSIVEFVEADNGGLVPWLPAGQDSQIFAPAPPLTAETISPLWEGSFLPAHPTIRQALRRLEELGARSRGLRTEEVVARLRRDGTARGGEGPLAEGRLERLDLVRRLAERRLGVAEVWPFQLAGALALLEGKLVELPNGAGKSLTAVLAGLTLLTSSRAVHFSTINDYLAERDAQRAALVAAPLGLSTFVLYGPETPDAAAAEYAPMADSPFGIGRRALAPGWAAHSEVLARGALVFGHLSAFVFTYLRQHASGPGRQSWFDPADCFLLADEADCQLIDNLNQSHSLSHPTVGTRLERDPATLARLRDLVDDLAAGEDYSPAPPFRLTEQGLGRVTWALGVDPYSPAVPGMALALRNTLAAKHQFKEGVDYLVEAGPAGRPALTLIHKGRLQYGARYQGGLHEALAVRRGLTPDGSDGDTTGFAINLNSFVNLYGGFAGLTATAYDDQREYQDYYGLPIVSIPAWREDRREVVPDLIFLTKAEKMAEVLDMVRQEYAGTRRPILVACENRAEALALSAALQNQGVPSQQLLAEHHRREAQIIAAAGQPGAVTVSAGMAGRGTDVRISPAAAAAGGLLVLGTYRSPDRREDEHLKGRAARHGLPGTAAFVLALEDDLLQAFSGAWVSGVLRTMGMEKGQAIQSAMVSRRVRAAQGKVKQLHRAQRRLQTSYGEAIERQRQLTFRLLRHYGTCPDLGRELEAVVRFAVSRWLGGGRLTDLFGRARPGALARVEERVQAVLGPAHVRPPRGRLRRADLEAELHRAVVGRLELDRLAAGGPRAEACRDRVLQALRETWEDYQRATAMRYEEQSLALANAGALLGEYFDWCDRHFRHALGECAERILRDVSRT
jgi:preprotein translocase subunit SecA